MIVDQTFFKNWSDPGHEYGACYIDQSRQALYVNIPKNASTWTKFQLDKLGFKNANYHQDNLYDCLTIFVALRDPIERWISGISWYMTICHPNLLTTINHNNTMIDLAVSIIKKRVHFDAHTGVQSKYIEGLNKSNITFFKVENNNRRYCKNFSKFIFNDLGLENDFDEAIQQHVAQGNEIQSAWVKIFKHCVESDKNFQQVLKQFYYNDYKLIESVKFYE